MIRFDQPLEDLIPPDDSDESLEDLLLPEDPGDPLGDPLSFEDGADPAPVGLLQPRIALDPENVSEGLGKLVLTLVEVIRQVLEKQALRRIEAGSLTEEEIERLGVTFLRLSEEMTRLRAHFGVDEDDLNLDLGPLGKLL
jgi:hypothetical protein